MKRKIVFLPYDLDTALGINNEGALAFGYNLEDTDHTASGAEIFNGQSSVLWNNLREAFGAEIKAMYQTLRSTGALSYPKVEAAFEAHQAKWGEAIFNEDAWFKYLAPLVEDGSGAYLAMLQGSKAEQRKWWLYNRFRYMDSKWNAGDALSDVITIRAYAKSNVTVVPYADIYASVRYGSYDVQQRATRGQAYTLVCPVDRLNDTEVYIYSASQLASVGDLSGFKVGYANFSMATKLQSLKLGDSDSEYENGNLTELYLGNNELLQTIDIRNCPNLTQPVDISGCKNIEYVYFDGTAITGLSLPNGGIVKALHLPATIANLTILNQPVIVDFTLPSASNVTTLRLENVSNAVDEMAILMALPAAARVRLIGFAWQAEDYAQVSAIYDRLDLMRGLDEAGGNVDTAQLMGTVHVPTLTGLQLASLRERRSDIAVTYDHITSTLSYYTYDGTLITTETINDGGDGTYAGTPERAADAQYTYTFAGWSLTMGGDADPNATKGVTADRAVYAAYSKTLNTYTVTFVRASGDGGGTLQTLTGVAYGTTPSYTGPTPTTTQGSATDYPFEGWTPALGPITGNTTYTAKFGSPVEIVEITDSWDDIIAACQNGSYTKYKVGNYKPLDLGTQGVVNMQIVAKDADALASGSGTAPLTWISKELLANTRRMNPAVQEIKEDQERDAWLYSRHDDVNGDWYSSNALAKRSDTLLNASWRITANDADTVKLRYALAGTVYSSWGLTMTINGEEQPIKENSTATILTYELSAGDVLEISASYNTNGTITASVAILAENSDISFTTQSVTVQVVVGYQDGTGMIGGWRNSEMRRNLRNSIKSKIPENVRNAIKEVSKYTNIYDTSGALVKDDITVDDVWIPSNREIFNNNSDETKGISYNLLFKDSNTRKKTPVDSTTNTHWWCRTATAYNICRYVYSAGVAMGSNAETYYRIALGFCT